MVGDPLHRPGRGPYVGGTYTTKYRDGAHGVTRMTLDGISAVAPNFNLVQKQ